jgi:hypothetical protein
MSDLSKRLRDLADKFSAGWHDGIKIDASDIKLLADAASALSGQSAPVAWRKPMLPTDYDYDGNDWRFSESGFIEPKEQEPLFTYQPRREPLPQEVVDSLLIKHRGDYDGFARAIEQAHYITGERT